MEQSLSIERILKELYHISGFRISIYDTNFREIAAYPHELGRFCQVIQKHPEGKRLCVEHDTMAFGRVREQESSISINAISDCSRQSPLCTASAHPQAI